MSEQRTFASVAWTEKKKVTRRERFLAEMSAVIPWAALVAEIRPHYPRPQRGRPPMPIETMLRSCFLQHWFDLSDPAAEDALYDSESMRRFVGLELCEDAIPDETTILRFRHLLEQHRLTERLFDTVRGLLEAKGLLLKAGTIVDATILNAPSSTKNATGTRDPEMKQRKGKTWYFGTKVHVGTDRRGLVHPLPERWRLINRARSRARARGEHAFHVVKTLWGFTKVRYRGLAKNTTRVFAAFALANLYLVRYRLRAREATCLPWHRNRGARRPLAGRSAPNSTAPRPHRPHRVPRQAHENEKHSYFRASLVA